MSSRAACQLGRALWVFSDLSLPSLAGDPTSSSRHPASLRASNGALEDSFYQAIDRQLYDGSSILGSILIVRSEMSSGAALKILKP